MVQNTLLEFWRNKMGYEIICYYKKRKKAEEESSDEMLSFKKRIGDPYEETPIEKLATAIMMQLARRDIWVDDVEIYEISKKKISFKETKSGIVIKNKKFIFNDDFEINMKEENEDPIAFPPREDQNLESELSVQKFHPLPQQNVVKRAIRKLMYAPEPQQHIELLQKGVKLTPDRAYDIIGIKKSPNGINDIYTINDDKNREQLVLDIFFVPHTELSQQKGSDGLSWGGVINDNIPSIR